MPPERRPASEDALAQILREAREPVAVRGGGTRGAPAGGAVLDTTALTGIRLHEPGALTIVAAAGTPLAEVEAALAAHHQHLAFEPPRTGPGSTIGGVVAANASGPRRVVAGACRDSLIGVRFVDGAGTVVKNGGRVMKNVTGIDLTKLMAGSRGALGVLTEVAFKVLPRPETRATVTLRGLDDTRAVAAMAAALGSPFEVTGAAHGPDGTHLRIEGFAGSVADRAERLAHVLAPFGTADVTEGEGPWPAIRDLDGFADAPGDLWRLSVRPSAAPGAVARAGALAHRMDWGGGRVWLVMPPGTDLRARLGAVPGHATRVRRTEADGIADLPPEVPALAALSAGLRARFDPRGILNPGPTTA